MIQYLINYIKLIYTNRVNIYKGICGKIRSFFRKDDPKVVHRRWLCNHCEHMDKAKGSCTLCGCFIELKIYSDDSCPIDKWDGGDKSLVKKSRIKKK